jgi:hypothetical protein
LSREDSENLASATVPLVDASETSERSDAGVKVAHPQKDDVEATTSSANFDDCLIHAY